MTEPEGACALGVDDEREIVNKKEQITNIEKTEGSTEILYTTVENFINLPLPMEPQLTEFQPVYSFPKTTIMTTLPNINYPLFSNQLVQPAPYAVQNPQVNYIPQMSTGQIIENITPPQT